MTLDRETNRVPPPMNLDAITRRQYLMLCALEDGAGVFFAKEAVATTLLDHPEWDTDEVKSWTEWRSHG